MVEVPGSSPGSPTKQSKTSLRHKDLHGSATRQPCVCRIENTETEYEIIHFQNRHLHISLASCGAHVENASLTFAKLVAAYFGQAKPNEPRDSRLKKWKTWLGAKVACGRATS
jgi:hypothetical protein